jgi:hypothetical protein
MRRVQKRDRSIERSPPTSRSRIDMIRNPLRVKKTVRVMGPPASHFGSAAELHAWYRTTPMMAKALRPSSPGSYRSW